MSRRLTDFALLLIWLLAGCDSGGFAPRGPITLAFTVQPASAVAGATATLDQPYDFFGVHVQAGLGYAFELGHGLFLEPQFQLGYLGVSRSFRDFTTHETLRTLTLSPALELEASPSDAFRIGVRLEVSFFSGQLEGPTAWHATGQLGLVAGYAF